MTARVSCSCPSGPHMCPDVRIIAGIDASTITSLGTCRLVIPRLESTIANSGPSARPCSIAALISAPDSMPSRPARMLPRPLFGLSPAAAIASPYRSNTSGRKARTTCPKMIGSDTFIIVALRCTENSTPSALARAIWASRNSCNAATCSAVASTTSPASTGTDSRSTVVSIVGDQRDPQRAGPIHHRRRLAGAEVVGGHVRDVGLGVRRPGAHRVRMVPRVLLDRRRRPTVGVALPQHRVDRTALDLVVAGPDVPLLIAGRVVGIVRQVVALALELPDRRLQLRHRRRDVRQLDDVRLGVLASAPSSASASACRYPPTAAPGTGR